MRIVYLQDPGHGWIIVPASLVRQLGCTPSRYSYVDRSADLAYLEEDCDAGPFIRALRASGVEPEIVDRHVRGDAACRSLPRWTDDAWEPDDAWEREQAHVGYAESGGHKYNLT